MYFGVQSRTVAGETDSLYGDNSSNDGARVYTCMSEISVRQVLDISLPDVVGLVVYWLVVYIGCW